MSPDRVEIAEENQKLIAAYYLETANKNKEQISVYDRTVKGRFRKSKFRERKDRISGIGRFYSTFRKYVQVT